MSWLQELGPQRKIRVSRPHVVQGWAGWLVRVHEGTCYATLGPLIVIDAYPTQAEANAALERLFPGTSVYNRPLIVFCRRKRVKTARKAKRFASPI